MIIDLIKRSFFLLDYPYLVCQAALFAGRFSRSLSAEVNRVYCFVFLFDLFEY